MNASKRRFVLDGQEDGAQAMYDLGQDLGWDLLDVVEPSDSRPGGLVFDTRDGARVSFVDDHLLDVCYVVIGESPVSGVLESLATAFELIDRNKARVAAEHALELRDVQALADAISRVAITAGPEPESWAVALFLCGLTHAHPALRLRAVQALTYTGLDREGEPWPELVSVLPGLKNDPEPAVARLAASLLDVMDRR